ncbi:MAG: hypothetical protein EOP45_13570, partial [Sphingobacteriaceae bacterium]
MVRNPNYDTRYKDIHYSKSEIVNTLHIKVHYSRVKLLSQMLVQPENLGAWESLNNQNTAQSLEQVKISMSHEIEMQTDSVGWTNGIFPLNTLLNYYFHKCNRKRIQKLTPLLHVLRRNELLVKIPKGLTMEIHTFLIWTIAYLPKIQEVGLVMTDTLEQIHEMEGLQLFKETHVQDMYFATTVFPIRFSENRLHHRKNDNDDRIQIIPDDQTITTGFESWIHDQCYDNGFHKRSVGVNQELYDVKHLAFVTGPYK